MYNLSKPIRRLKVFLQRQAWFRIVSGMRWIYFRLRKKYPEILNFEVEDPVLLHSRNVKISYQVKNVSIAEVAGITSSIKPSGSFVFELPEGKKEVTIIFHGAGEPLVRTAHFRFIPVSVSKGLKEQRYIVPSIPSLPHVEYNFVSTVAPRLKTVNSFFLKRHGSVLMNSCRILTHNQILQIPYPEIDKSNRV